MLYALHVKRKKKWCMLCTSIVATSAAICMGVLRVGDSGDLSEGYGTSDSCFSWSHVCT